MGPATAARGPLRPATVACAAPAPDRPIESDDDAATSGKAPLPRTGMKPGARKLIDSSPETNERPSSVNRGPAGGGGDEEETQCTRRFGPLPERKSVV